MNEPTNRPEYLWAMADILTFAQETESFLTSEINVDDPDEIAGRIAMCINAIPSLNNALAAAKWYAEAAYKMEYEKVWNTMITDDVPRPMLAASVLKDYIKSRTSEFLAILVRIEKLNSGTIHTLEGLRSILSKLKEDRRAASYGQNL
jgi:hypothetical protein